MPTATDAPAVAPQTAAADPDVPRPLTPDDLVGSSTTLTVQTAGPDHAPPGSAAAAVATAVGAWQADKRITALWQNSSVRNAWMHVDGVGWKRLNPANDSAWSAMVLLASQARQTGCRIDYRDEADGLVHEIYLW